MNTCKYVSRVVLSLMIVLPVPAVYAEDIDIYSRPETTTANPALNPNILIVLDNSSNWASANQHWPNGIKQGESELNALRTVIGELDDKTNVGLMMFTSSGDSGGYVRYHVRQMTAANKLAFSELIGHPTGCADVPNSLNGTPNCILKNFQTPSEKVSASHYGTSMLEVFKYFGGYTWPAHAHDDVSAASAYSSAINNRRQFGTMRYAGPDANADPAAYTDASKTSYNSPLSSANSCAKNYVIFIGNGFPSQDGPSTLLGGPDLLPSQGVGGDVTQLPMPNVTLTTLPPQTTLLATTACGTYPGATATVSNNNCNADTTLSTRYPGYDSVVCEPAATHAPGSTCVQTDNLGDTSCGLYSSQAQCQGASPWGITGYTSYSCGAGTACTSTSDNPDIPVATTACIANALDKQANCIDYGASNYPGYSGFTCTSAGSTGCPSKQSRWRIDATTKITTGMTFARTGYTTRTTTTTTFSQYIKGTSTITGLTHDGTYSAPTSNINYFDEWARYLNQTDVSAAPGRQNISTFTIDVYKDAPDADQTRLLMTAARAGGGKYFKASDENAIINALRKIFSEISSVNSVFASSSLPVSVNTQGTYLNQVFMGMFRPEGGASPRWPGNLKQYKFKIFNGILRLADKNGDQAINPTTGFITPCADSYWTTDTGQYWNYGGSLALGGCPTSDQPSAFPSAGSSAVYSDAPDGEVVEKGGAAQRLRGVTGGSPPVTSTRYEVCGVGQTPSNTACRKLLTCDGSGASSCTAFTNFDTTNTAIDATALNITDSAQVSNLINWTRGKDIDNENGNLLPDNVTPKTAEMRPSVHGGVVHSQPAVIDYGSPYGTVAFYGADDGVLHAVDGGQTDDDGIELWGFIAPETIKKLNRLRTASPPIAFPGVSGSPAPTPKDYFFDGSIGVYQYKDPDTNVQTVWIYSSMRRGGRSIYAFDVSNPTSPLLLWRKGCFTSDTADDSMCSSDTVTPSRWLDIGQTWSHPTITYIKGFVDGSNNPKPVLIFGGGYDKCEDDHLISGTVSQTPECSSTRKGANIWFVDAANGNIIRTYPTLYSVPGDLAEVKDNLGFVTHVYASDMGGNVYRINVGTSNASGSILTSWSDNATASQTIIASLRETNHARKFLYGPSVVPASKHNAVLLGSGDREHPLVTDYGCNNYSTTAGNYVTNQFYMLIDNPAAGYPSPTVAATDLVNVTSGTTTYSTDTGTATITNTPVGGGTPTSSTKGWRFNFGPCEQTVNEPLTIAGVTYFGTNAPSSSTGNSCTANLGKARGYAVDYLNANPIPANASMVGSGSGSGTSSTDPDTGPGAVGEVINGEIAGENGGSRSGEYIGGGMPPSPVAGVVEVENESGIGTTKVPFCIGCIGTGATSALEGSKVDIKPPGNRHRSFWYMESD